MDITGREAADGIQREPISNNNLSKPLETIQPLMSAGQVPAIRRDESRRERQKAENANMQEPLIPAMPSAMSVEQMEADCIWISDGSAVGFLSDPRYVLSFNDFDNLMADAKTKIEDETGRKKLIPNAKLWRQSDKRQKVFTRTFHAGAKPICGDPDGKKALNSWRRIERWEARADVQPFIDHVAYLFPDEVEREVFLNWLAHIEQKPGELPHYGWLHIAQNTGTGRNWLASLLARVWRGYVAPNVDLPALLDSPYNGQLSSRLLVIVDEVQEGAGENPYRHANRLKSLVNAEYRDINPKFGRQYREHNACRWLVFSNHDNALPLTDNDRRFRVARHSVEPRSVLYYEELYKLLDNPEFINAIGWYLSKRGISGFKPGERPPMNDAKRAAVNASKTMIQQYAQQLVDHLKADIITNSHAAEWLSGGNVDKGFTPAMRRALEELGCVGISKTLKIDGNVHRCWVIRNINIWLQKTSSEQSREAKKSIPLPGQTINDVIANDIAEKEEDAPY